MRKDFPRCTTKELHGQPRMAHVATEHEGHQKSLYHPSSFPKHLSSENHFLCVTSEMYAEVASWMAAKRLSF